MNRPVVTRRRARRTALAAALACLAATGLAATGCGAQDAAPTPSPVAPGSPTTTTPPAPSPTRAAPGIGAAFAALPEGLAARAGLAVAPVGAPSPAASGRVTSWGEVDATPAWSTIKVPLSVAAGDGGREQAGRALRSSDNAAAAALWAGLGGGAEAARAVEDELRAGGDGRTVVQYAEVRAPYTPYGQTVWPGRDAAAYASSLPCRPAAAASYDAMRGVVPEQRWGLGRVDAEAFKGGWGPHADGRFLARQIGVLTRPDGLRVAVALVVLTPGGYERATAELDILARFARDHVGEFPAGRC